MTDCVFSADTMRCQVCGAYATRSDARRNCGGPGLGDRVASVLDAIGITKDRVEALVGGPCGCPERQAALNAAGAKWLGLPPGSTAQGPMDSQT